METIVKGNTALKGEAIKPVVMTVSKPETEKKPETSKTPEVKPDPVEVKPLTFEEIRTKGMNLFNLSAKYDQVKAKADELKKFKILHNKDVAQIQLKDAQGNTFVSGNPKAISAFIGFCCDELETTLKEVETEMRKIA